MPKQKHNKLYCDQVADENMRLIQKIGKVADENIVFQTVADDFTEQALAKGVPERQVDFLVCEQMSKLETMSQMAGLTALNNWYWSGRQVYRFDPELAELLYAQTKDDVDIDSKTLLLLPCPHFYISLEDKIRKGFFVSYINDNIYFSDYLSDAKDSYVEAYLFPVPKNETKLTDIIEHLNAEYKRKVTRKQVLEFSKRISGYLQFVVYLSAINAEIEPVTKGSIVTRQAGKKPVIRQGRTEISNVGYRLGNTIRASKTEKATIKYVGEHSQGSQKSPHIRRSHFHSFWTGSGEDKALIVKWVNTIFVHGNENNNDISTVHKVKQ